MLNLTNLLKQMVMKTHIQYTQYVYVSYTVPVAHPFGHPVCISKRQTAGSHQAFMQSRRQACSVSMLLFNIPSKGSSFFTFLYFRSSYGAISVVETCSVPLSWHLGSIILCSDSNHCAPKSHSNSQGTWVSKVPTGWSSSKAQ